MIQEPEESFVDIENEDPTITKSQEIVVKPLTSPAANDLGQRENRHPLANIPDPNVAGIMLLINQDQKLQEKLSSERNALYRDLINKL